MSHLYWKSCNVCCRDIDWKNVEQTTVRGKLEGWVAYGICFCGMEAMDAKDQNYRRRWRKAQKEAHGRGNSAPVSRGKRSD